MEANTIDKQDVVDRVIDIVTDKTNREMFWWMSVYVEEKFEIDDKEFFKIYIIWDDWEKKYTIAENLDKIKIDNFVFDNCWVLKEGEEIFILWWIWEKYWYIRQWEEDKLENKIIFDNCFLSESYGELVVYGEIWDKKWYIRLWEENKIEEMFVKNNNRVYLNHDKEWIYMGYGRWNKWNKIYL